MVLVGLVLLPVGCGAGQVPVPQAPPSAVSTAPPPPLSPLTGLASGATAPVFAVKIDNTAKARPWDGVESADIVYVEPVEGGLTRLLAVFASVVPPSVGPVRSARDSDIGILGAYGRPALVYSGAAPPVVDAIVRAPLVSTVPRDVPGASRRDAGRAAPTNLYADLAALRTAVPQAAPARDIGLRFGPPPTGGAPAPERTVRIGSTSIGVTWSPESSAWSLASGGEPLVFGPSNAPMRADTVLVQRIRTVPSPIRDAAGSVSPVAVTVGEGAAEVLRDGRSFPARWSRPTGDAPTRLTGPDGRDVPLTPGRTWVLLADS